MIAALEQAAAVRAGRVRAVDLAQAALSRLAADRHVAVTRLLPARALDEAARIDAQVAQGIDPGPLAGVPYGVKDLFDVAGEVTTAGSAVRAHAAPAASDAVAITRLRDAGAVLVATLNMDEFAYGFATINAHHGTTRNPHDPTRLAGGSSGGSAAVVAAGHLAFALGSDTNGSIRVPASLCGLYGLKPTHADLPVDGTFPFAHSFDDIGPFTGNLADLRAIWAILSGHADAAPLAPPRVGMLGSRFAENLAPAQQAAIAAVVGQGPCLTLPDLARYRSAAFLITAYEGGTLHRADLARAALEYDPAVRDRLIAGSLLPRALYDAAQALRAQARADIDALFEAQGVDVLVAPAAPCVAPLIADPRILIDGAMVPARADLGIHTQPITFLGLPALCVPLARAGQLPLGLQLIGRRHGETALFACAQMLEEQGVVGATAPGALAPQDFAGERQ
ncbi:MULTISPECIES: AtzE family amidohydrolase [unclassified Novosphingobium]|uniref:AtzE family amidohydrolase n=1 Tax=unclassified Novosphingobium TaxID=2644732 RepID=UPI001440EB8C|nr:MULTISPECIES: AtzE family amidohydrolase [unclassified Novosphingobium]MBB3357611.1 aspartyl-tRNA(Asn)/glutamyl-tRNA(Gln) amidotransferase subunit A [Novosphingobium sp. BK256]MBB3373725.1 aspartyl-tRNA(Asn)/glutamyl-tRNA(Gln) amidotransferase subunit A [Novosphingobium sp. BK280]MBB3378137.1 aspartyl-tRNA(Asn)/glutamyl-tRNA(Gln) amidotransferase subunit A [Novosphingobium sp. BK258]MBB3420078.1 aspartyl-tRNA(Asn)/glutamyl-tRNA(Gln) amidotransferase subunit A [Novosphingobium sp. BK267]MBB3